MFHLSQNAKIILFNQPVNMHNSIDSLSAIAKGELKIDLTVDTYFLFSNRKRDRIKVLYFDGTNVGVYFTRFDSTLNFRYEKIQIFNRESFDLFLKNRASRKRIYRYKMH